MIIEDSGVLVFKVLRESGFEFRILLLKSKFIFRYDGFSKFIFFLFFLKWLFVDKNYKRGK